ncbi:MAG: adenylate/guanylate cyclase domain-containing protein [Gemmatimonadota bacterium]
MSILPYGLTYIDVSIDGVDRTFDLTDLQALSIGRDPRSTVVLANDPMVSRRHSIVQKDAMGGWILSDMGSRNGTVHNGMPVTAPTPLMDGDTFTIGSHRFAFYDSSKPENQVETHVDATAMLVIERLITIMVLDLRDYTGLSRRLGEATISELMNKLFGEAGKLLKKNGSWAQKYIGDAVMAFWVHADEGNTPEEHVKMLESIVELEGVIAGLAEWFKIEEGLRFGIGINTGIAVTGNMGSAAVADHTAMGDSVNKAFRLEAATKEVGQELVVGQSTFDVMALPDEVAALFQSHTVTLKGYDAPEVVWGLDLSMVGAVISALRAS